MKYLITEGQYDNAINSYIDFLFEPIDIAEIKKGKYLSTKPNFAGLKKF